MDLNDLNDDLGLLTGLEEMSEGSEQRLGGVGGINKWQEFVGNTEALAENSDLGIPEFLLQESHDLGKVLFNSPQHPRPLLSLEGPLFILGAIGILWFAFSF